MKRILIVSIAFPPKGDPESIQVGWYVQYLSNSNYEIDVITSSDPTLYMEVDSEFQYLREGINKIHEFKLIENRYLNWILRKLSPSILEKPDSKLSFYLSNPKVEKPDLIYSRSYPLSSTLLGLKLKQRWPELPWVLHLSDPWALSYSGNSPATSFGKRSRKWNKQKEIECFKFADLISFTSQKTVDLYRREYPSLDHKFIITPNVYDDKKRCKNSATFDDKLTITYTGGFGEKRSPTFYLKAIQRLIENNTQIKDQLKFIFTGPMTKKNKKIFDSLKDVEQITHLGVVPYSRLVELQEESHVLVNIDSDIKESEHSVFFPSKLLEYFVARKRILAITNPHSVTYELIQNKFGECINFEDYNAFNTTIIRYLHRYAKRDVDFFHLRNDIDKYGAKFNSKILLDHFDQLLS